MTERSNDKILFRQDTYPIEQAATLPEDLQWALQRNEYISGGVGGAKSKIGSIIFTDDKRYDGDPVIERSEHEPIIPQVPTPTINRVVSSNVYQTIEGFSKADVFVEVQGMDGVEYEVVVTPV